MSTIIAIDELQRLGNELRARNLRVVLTNGHFDLLHVGHVRYLQAARNLGDRLIVAVNNDHITRQRKGPTRPILPERERAELVAALRSVDYVTIFSESTADRVIELLKPDVYVKGGDYAKSDDDLAAGKAPLPEASTVQAYGGEVHIIDLEPGQSTTSIENRIIESFTSARKRCQ